MTTILVLGAVLLAAFLSVKLRAHIARLFLLSGSLVCGYWYLEDLVSFVAEVTGSGFLVAEVVVGVFLFLVALRLIHAVVAMAFTEGVADEAIGGTLAWLLTSVLMVLVAPLRWIRRLGAGPHFD